MEYTKNKIQSLVGYLKSLYAKNYLLIKAILLTLYIGSGIFTIWFLITIFY